MSKKVIISRILFYTSVVLDVIYSVVVLICALKKVIYEEHLSLLIITGALLFVITGLLYIIHGHYMKIDK